MLCELELQKIATRVGEELCEAHRGAVRLSNGRSVIVFMNDGHAQEAVGRAALANVRTVLTADGFTLGPGVLDPEDGYTAVFEAIPPTIIKPLDALEMCEAAVWEGWAAARNLDADHDDFACLQRGIALGVTAGRTI